MTRECNRYLCLEKLWETGLTDCRFYCIWDSFRAQHPLLSIIDPVAQTKMVRTLIDIYRFLGKCSTVFGIQGILSDTGFRQASRLPDELFKGLQSGWEQCRRCDRRCIPEGHY